MSSSTPQLSMERYSSAQLFEILKIDGPGLFDVDSLSEYLELGSVGALETGPAFQQGEAWMRMDHHVSGRNRSSS